MKTRTAKTFVVTVTEPGEGESLGQLRVQYGSEETTWAVDTSNIRNLLETVYADLKSFLFEYEP